MYDAELVYSNYGDSTLTLARHGGTNAEDVFNGAGTLSFADGSVKLDGTTVGSYVQDAGTLTLSFLSGTTQANINGVLSQIAYSNTAASLPASPVQIDWTFNDGNTAGGQGTGGALSASGSTTVRFNHSPTVAHPLADQSATGNSAYSYTVPADAFADPDVGDTLTYTATKADGSALPAWLVFNATARAFSGTPTNADAGSLAIKITARDGSAATVTDEFALTVSAGSTGGGGGGGGTGGGTVPTPPPNPEDQVPSPNGGTPGDGNGDGIADSQQSSVESLTVDPTIPQTGDKSYVTFHVGDGQAVSTNSGVFTLNLTAPSSAKMGTDGANRLNGTGKADLILGKGGNDRLYGEAGQDNLKGGAGNDALSGGAGDDKLYGQDGKDSLVGGAGNDLLDGGAGKDIYRYLTSQFGLDDLAAGSHDVVKATKGDTLAFDASLWAHLTQNGTALDDLAGKGLLKQIDADTNIAYDGHSLLLDLNGDGLFQAGQDMSIDIMGVHKVGVDATGQFLVLN